ncbi:MAG TPA: hypothetical protein VNN22_25435 [Verrucomicrobiae bacterium]|nr:hypothetical protein [Verrucomicrobiae bacterium]
MAKKVNALRLAQISHGHAEVTNRLPTPLSPALYLTQLRLPRWNIMPIKRKLPIAIGDETKAEMEYPVKITLLG